MDPEHVFALCRALNFVSLMFAFGGGAYLTAIAPAEMSDCLQSRLKPLFTFAALGAMISTLVWLPVQAAVIGEGWADATPGAVFDLATLSTFGRIWMFRVVAAVALMIFVLKPAAITRLGVGLSGALLASLALLGHAAMHQGGLGIAHRTNDSIHLIASGFWLGALIPLSYSVAFLADGRLQKHAAEALNRFSATAVWAVIVVIITGISNTWLVLGDWPSNLARHYDYLLVIKIGCVAAMIGLALLNRFRFAPQAAAGDRAGIAALRLSITAEVLIGGCVLSLVAYFGTLDPA